MTSHLSGTFRVLVTNNQDNIVLPSLSDVKFTLLDDYSLDYNFFTILDTQFMSGMLPPLEKKSPSQ